MIMDSKGKLFGKVSIVDAAIVLAVIIAIAGVYVRFGGGMGKAVSQQTTFYYTMRVRDFREPTKVAIENSMGKEFFLNEKKESDMGKLIDAQFSPAMGVLEKADGTVVTAEIPNKYDAVLTFEMSGKANEKGYFSPQLQQINAGTTHVIKSKLVTFYGMVLAVWE